MSLQDWRHSVCAKRDNRALGDTVGVSATLRTGALEMTLGGGDSGHTLRKDRYHPVGTVGRTARLGLGSHVQIGAGGQWMKEAGVDGNVHAPYDTPGVNYEDWVRGEVIQSFRAVTL